MARNFTIQWEPQAVNLPFSAYASFAQLPTNIRPYNAFDATTDESVYLEGILPPEYTGSGTLKLRILAVANTTTAADDARIDCNGEFVTFNNSESGNVDSFNATADSGTFTFSTTAYSVQELIITLTNIKSQESPVVGDKFKIRVTRDADHASLDSLAVDLLIIGYELYEEV